MELGQLLRLNIDLDPVTDQQLILIQIQVTILTPLKEKLT